MNVTIRHRGEGLVPSTPTVIVIDFRINQTHKLDIFSSTESSGKGEVTFEKWLLD